MALHRMCEMSLSHFILSLFTVLFVSFHGCDAIQCLNEANQPVDWYYLYKLPMIKTSSSFLVKTGVAYAFMTSDTNEGWQMSNYGIDSKNSFPGQTLAHLYEDAANQVSEPSDEMWMMYNDQPPNGNVSFTKGHSKGVIAGNNDGGVWLVHSVPHFPPPPETKTYSYPKTGMKNGQSFLCISMNAQALDTSALQLIFNNPLLYSQHFGEEALTHYPQLHNVSKFEGKVKSPPYTHKVELTSKFGSSFISYAKTSKFKKDLYDDYLTEDLETALRVETWPNGKDRLQSDCVKPFHTENIDAVKIGLDEFSSHKDHSKWAISTDDTKPWTCVGDINRAKTQFVRGGGTVCFQDPRVHASYYQVVAGVEGCSNPPNHDLEKSHKKKSKMSKIAAFFDYIRRYYKAILNEI